MVDFVARWSSETELPASRFVRWLGIHGSKFFDWKQRYGKANEHNALVPRDHWLEQWERDAIATYAREHLLDGYRRLAFMMLDENVVAVSPASVYRVLKPLGLLNPWNVKPTKKGTGFVQPLQPHEHWHIDFSYLNICGTFYYLCSVLDGCSRFVVHWEIRESMKEKDVELVLQRAKEKFPNAHPRIISDNGPQFVAKDLKEFIRVSGMDHVRTSPYYPQSNGKVERLNQTLKAEAIRPKTPLSVEEARATVGNFIDVEYNTRRLHSAIGYVTPKDRLDGRHETIWKERDTKLEKARARRAFNRELRHQQAARLQNAGAQDSDSR